MDVNTIGNNLNSIKSYNNSNDVSQYSTSNISNNNGQVPVNSVVEQTKETQNNEQNKEKFDKKELDKAVKKLNKFLEDEKTHAQYSVHEDLGTLMIKIVNDEDKVILELPPEKILDMVASMCKQVGLLDRKA